MPNDTSDNSKLAIFSNVHVYVFRFKSTYTISSPCEPSKQVGSPNQYINKAIHMICDLIVMQL